MTDSATSAPSLEDSWPEITPSTGPPEIFYSGYLNRSTPGQIWGERRQLSENEYTAPAVGPAFYFHYPACRSQLLLSPCHPALALLNKQLRLLHHLIRISHPLAVQRHSSSPGGVTTSFFCTCENEPIFIESRSMKLAQPMCGVNGYWPFRSRFGYTKCNLWSSRQQPADG